MFHSIKCKSSTRETMRSVINEQMQLGEIGINNIPFDLNSRDEIPQILMGLQYIYSNDELFRSVFGILEDLTPQDVNAHLGRPGMQYWSILVLGVLRLGCNIDYDKLKELADQHTSVRLMMGRSTVLDDDKFLPLQTIKDNVSLVTPDIMDRMNQEVIKHGHRLLGKSELDDFHARCDSYVLQTNVHYPTDINLLLDAMGKVIHLMSLVCATSGMTDWRQSDSNLKKVKQAYRNAQRTKKSTSKDPKKQAEKEIAVKEAYLAYLDLCAEYLSKAEVTIQKLKNQSYQDDILDFTRLIAIQEYMDHAFRQIDQTHRRVIQGEKIPHDEKVFSIFETHTEWISKGKAGVPQELGLKVCILEDEYGFICHHEIMRSQTDDQIAVKMITETKKRFTNLVGCSFDKGFYSPIVKDLLSILLDQLILPKKGKLNKEERDAQKLDEYVKARKKHSAIESAINSLEHHGLDRCPDKGLEAFERYVAMGILSKNIHTLGRILMDQQKQEAQKAA